MARPNLTSRRPGIAGVGHSSNPFTNWLENRKERRRQAEEEASRLITNKIAENENIIIDKLSSIDFFHSRLPKNVLEAKAREEQPCGDLEYAAKGVIHMLRKNPQTIKMDIRKIDQKLLTLVLLFKQTVEQGDIRASYAAKGAIVRAVADIRCRIPQEQPELATMFVEANSKYLDQWITLVTLSQVADRTKQNVDVQKDRLEKAQARSNEEVDELQKRIREDDAFLVAFNKLTEHTANDNRSTWSEVEREVHRMMVERRMERANLELNSILLQQQEMDLSTKEMQVEMLYSKVASLPIVTDPDLMNKYQESIDELFRQLAESDAQIDETLKSMDDIEGRIQQLNHAPGSLRAQEVAAEEAEKVLAEVTKLQNDQSGKTAVRAKKMREEMGILSEEQLAEQKRQAELEMQRAAEIMREQMEEQEQEPELLTN